MARVGDVSADLVRPGSLVQTGNRAKQRPSSLILQSFSAFGGRGPQRIGRNVRRRRQSGGNDLDSKSLSLGLRIAGRSGDDLVGRIEPPIFDAGLLKLRRLPVSRAIR
jgi:hypothetical protein